MRQVVPLIPDTIRPPRGSEDWKSFFAKSSDVLEGEEQRVLSLARSVLKSEPIGRWLLAQSGIGPAIGISILGECWPLTRFTSPGKLWAFAGLHVTAEGHAPRRKRGEKANWNGRLKTRVWLFVSMSIQYNRQPWRELYDRRKALEQAKLGLGADAPIPSDTLRVNELGADLEAESLAPEESANTPVSSARRPPPLKMLAHRRAMRFVAKLLLKDLWRVAHGQEPLTGTQSE